jgi:hypothetical protein
MALELLIRALPYSPSTGRGIAFVVFLVTLIIGYANKKKVTGKTLILPAILIGVAVLVMVIFRIALAASVPAS